MSLLAEGQNVRDTYEVERKLGEGAFAEVYRVRHRFLGRQAMKVFKVPGMALGEIEEMLGEATMLSRIGHPNIVRVFDANVAETSRGTCGFFTMEYVAGGTLEQFWRSHGSNLVAIETAVEIGCQVSRALSVGHSEKPPIIHRDIKPQNILIGYDAAGLRARVSDFGLAKRVNPLTLMASARGTRTFKPPEVFRDLNADSCAGDVWAIGSVLYLLLTDRLPFLLEPNTDLFDSKCFEQPMIPASRLNVHVDSVLDQIVFRALSLDPERRYSNAIELLDALMAWRPRPSTGMVKVQSSDTSKSVLGRHTPADEHLARRMVDQAVRLGREAGKLMEAADLLEEALNKSPNLREEKEYLLKLWRRGIVL